MRLGRPRERAGWFGSGSSMRLGCSYCHLLIWDRFCLRLGFPVSGDIKQDLCEIPLVLGRFLQYKKTLSNGFICKSFIKEVLPDKLEREWGKQEREGKQQGCYFKEGWWQPYSAGEFWNVSYNALFVLTQGRVAGLPYSLMNQLLAYSHLGRQWWW